MALFEKRLEYLLQRLQKQTKKIVLLDGDLAGGTGAHHFLKKYPERFVQCGIAEQNMISVSAGMASIGLIPFATTFAVFALRAFEQARLSISYTNLNVKIVASHGGLDTGPDGASAQCINLACFKVYPTLQSSALVIAMRCFRLLKQYPNIMVQFI